MNIQEMHIEVNQSTQQIAANANRKLYAEEIDWVLNKMMTRFIQIKIKPKEKRAYRKDQLDLDGLRSLFVSQKAIQTFLTTGILKRVTTPLPEDYYHIIEDNSATIDLCNGVELTKEQYYDEVTYLELSDSQSIAALKYLTLILTIDGDTIDLPGDLKGTTSYVGYRNAGDVLFLQSFVLYRLRELGYTVYWERYNEIYKRNTFIIKGTYTPTLTIDGVDVTVTSTESISENVITNTETPIVVANRLTWETVGNLLNTAFYKSSIQSPISEVSQNVLYTYYDENFTVTTTLLSYIRKPRVMSLSLGSDCDLDEGFHQMICDMSTEYIKNRLGDGPGYQLAVNDNQNRVNL